MVLRQKLMKVILVVVIFLGLWKVFENWSVVSQIDPKPDIPPSPKLEKYENKIFDEFSHSDLSMQAEELFVGEHLHSIEKIGEVDSEFGFGSKPNLWFLLVKNVKAKDVARNIINELRKLGEKAFVQTEYDSGGYLIYVGPIIDFQRAEQKKSMVDDSLGVDSKIYLYAREFSS